MGHDTSTEPVEDGDEPFFGRRVFVQKMQGGDAEVSVVHHRMVSTLRGLSRLIHIGPPSFHDMDQSVCYACSFPVRQCIVQKIQGQGKGVHIAVGGIKVFFHPVAMIPGCGGQQPGFGPFKPPVVTRHPPCKGIVFYKGGRLHRRIEGEIQLMEGVRAVWADRYLFPRLMVRIGFAIRQDIAQYPFSDRIIRQRKRIDRVVGRMVQPGMGVA